MKYLQVEKGFKKDLEKAKKSGQYSVEDFKTLKTIINRLQKNETIESIYRRHPLRGTMKGYEAIHIKNDWLLIFKSTEKSLSLVMLGKHTQVYKKFK
jgi:mRNA interferase YafQ